MIKGSGHGGAMLEIEGSEEGGRRLRVDARRRVCCMQSPDEKWSPILPILVLSLAGGEVGVTNRGCECKGRSANEAGDKGGTSGGSDLFLVFWRGTHFSEDFHTHEWDCFTCPPPSPTHPHQRLGEGGRGRDCADCWG